MNSLSVLVPRYIPEMRDPGPKQDGILLKVGEQGVFPIGFFESESNPGGPRATQQEAISDPEGSSDPTSRSIPKTGPAQLHEF